MSLDTVMEIISERGLSVFLAEDGKPRLRGPKEEMTPVLKEALDAYRDEIMERLKPKPPPPRRRFLWRFGHMYMEQEQDTRFCDPDHYSVGAWWWRNEGEQGWRPVPGRNQENLPPPEGETLA